MRSHTSRGGAPFTANLLHCASRGLDIIIVLTTAPEHAILTLLSLGVALKTGQSGASEAAEPRISLALIWLAFAGNVALLWSWCPWRGRWTPPLGNNIQRKICEMLGISWFKGYQVEALEAVCLNKCGALVCVPTVSRNSACFEVGLTRPVIDHVTGRELAAEYGVCDWPDSYRFENPPPGDVTAPSA